MTMNLKTRHDNDPIILTARAIETMRHEMLDRLDGQDQHIAVVEKKADLALDRHANGEYLFAIPWLESHGVKVPGEYQGAVGCEIAEIAEELGGDPRPFSKFPHKGYMTNRYSPGFMDRLGHLWNKRNFVKESRRGWFRNGS